MRRLTKTQKYWAVVMVLCKSRYPLTRNLLGKVLGFADGKPIHETMELLLDEGHLGSYQEEMLGMDVTYYYMLDASKDVCSRSRLDAELEGSRFDTERAF